MKSITVDGREYKIKVLPPWLQSQILRYQMLSRSTPKTPEEADQIEADMKRCFDRLFIVVDPKPTEADAGEVFVELLKHLAESVSQSGKDAESFH